MAFVKLDVGILDSTLWSEDAKVRVVFITMLTMARPDGLCESTAPGIARRANLPVKDVERALKKLEAPDTQSRSPDEDGRRVIRVDGGYQIVTYQKYRAKDHSPRGARGENEGAHRSYVYFVTNAMGDIKIGHSSNPWARVRELSVGAGPLTLLGAIRGNVSDERSWHEKFIQLRKHGEWFSPGEDLLQAIKNAIKAGYVALRRSSDAAPYTEAEADVEAEEEQLLAGMPLGIPAQAIANLYNKTMVKLPKVIKLNPPRRRAIKRAWHTDKRWQNLEFWQAYFEECQTVPFLNGTGPYGNGHENWLPDFDFLMKEKIILRVYERAIHRAEQRKLAQQVGAPV